MSPSSESGASACRRSNSPGTYGREVLAIDVSEQKLEQATAVGAQRVALSRSAVAAAAGMQEGGPHVVLDCAGTPDAVESSLALLALRQGTRLVQVGYSKTSRIDLPVAKVVLDELQVMGCRAAALADLADALGAVGRGEVRPILGEERSLEEAQTAIDALAAGSAAGRQVLVVSDDGWLS